MNETITITRTCPISGEENSLTVDKVAYEQWKGGVLIQRAFPTLSPDEREFLITGISPRGWEMMSDEGDS